MKSVLVLFSLIFVFSACNTSGDEKKEISIEPQKKWELSNMPRTEAQL